VRSSFLNHRFFGYVVVSFVYPFLLLLTQTITVKEVMTPMERVFMLGVDEKLSFETIGKIFKTGYSRIPVYEISRNNIIGLLFVKDLIFIDPEDEVPIRSFIQIFGRSVHVVWPDDTLGDVLGELKKGRSHLAVVRDVNNEDESQDPYYEVKGIITLEGELSCR
jgi:metal transporter CNNM